MHVLIIPSEEYLPNYNQLEGIFQHDQARILINEGHQVGAISFSFLTTYKVLIRAILGRKTPNLKGYSRSRLILRLLGFIFLPLKTSIEIDSLEKINLIRTNCFLGFNRSGSNKVELSLLKEYGDFAFKLYLKKFGMPVIIHAHNCNKGGLLGEYISKKYNIPLVITEHSSQHFMKGKPLEIEQNIKSLLELNNISAVSPSLANQLTKIYNLPGKEIHWFPNVMDGIFEDEELFDNFKLANTVFLSIGTLIPLKGHKELIHAFSKAFPKGSGRVLKIGGAGPLKMELENLILQLGISESVELLGNLSRNEVLEEIKNCSCFVLPSHYETFGVVLIEALALGKPCIAARCGGPDSIIDNHNGILVQPKNVEELSLALGQIELNLDKYNSREIKLNTIEMFGHQAFYSRIISLYNKTIDDYNN